MKRKVIHVNRAEWQMLTAIQKHQEEHNTPPTVYEAMERLGWSKQRGLSPLGNLVAKGILAPFGNSQWIPAPGVLVIWSDGLADVEGADLAQFDEYQRVSRNTVNRQIGDWERQINHALGLAGETGEVVDRLKKILFHGHDADPAIIAGELGDLLWYLSQIATDYDLRLSEVARGNIDKLQGPNGRYTNGFSAKASRERER